MKSLLTTISTCVFSLVRLVAVIQNRNNPDATCRHLRTPTPSSEPADSRIDSLGIVAIWSTVEPCLGIVATCLPTLRPIVKSFFGRSHFLSGTSQNKLEEAGSRSMGSRVRGDAKSGFQQLYNSNDLVSAQTFISANSKPLGIRDDQLPLKTFDVETHSTWILPR